jgi:hypothetical protein
VGAQNNLAAFHILKGEFASAGGNPRKASDLKSKTEAITTTTSLGRHP